VSGGRLAVRVIRTIIGAIVLIIGVLILYAGILMFEWWPLRRVGLLSSRALIMRSKIIDSNKRDYSIYTKRNSLPMPAFIIVKN